MSKRKGLHKYKRSIRVLPQTSYNLDRLADLSGLKTPGRVVDKLVRDTSHIATYIAVCMDT